MELNPGRAYRQVAAQGVSLVGLVIQSYDQIVDALYAAGRAIEAHEIERKTSELNRAFALLSHLQSALDFESGAEVGHTLEHFYNLARNRMIDASGKNSAQALAQVASDFLTVREAWQEVEKPVTPSAKVRQELHRLQALTR